MTRGKSIKRIFHKPFEGRTHTDFHFTGKHDSKEAHSREMAELLYVVEYTGRKFIRGISPSDKG